MKMLNNGVVRDSIFVLVRDSLGNTIGNSIINPIYTFTYVIIYVLVEDVVDFSVRSLVYTSVKISSLLQLELRGVHK
jgi:hypothetical protein